MAGKIAFEPAAKLQLLGNCQTEFDDSFVMKGARELQALRRGQERLQRDALGGLAQDVLPAGAPTVVDRTSAAQSPGVGRAAGEQCPGEMLGDRATTPLRDESAAHRGGPGDRPHRQQRRHDIVPEHAQHRPARHARTLAELAHESDKPAAQQHPPEHRAGANVDGIVAAMAVHHQPGAGPGGDPVHAAPHIVAAASVVGDGKTRLEVVESGVVTAHIVMQVERRPGSERLDRRARVMDGRAAFALLQQ